jgi:hypothetical protein
MHFFLPRSLLLFMMVAALPTHALAGLLSAPAGKSR